jgi:hypothetical protein
MCLLKTAVTKIFRLALLSPNAHGEGIIFYMHKTGKTTTGHGCW